MGKLSVRGPGRSAELCRSVELTSGLSPEHHENFTADRYRDEVYNLSGGTKLSFAFESGRRLKGLGST